MTDPLSDILGTTTPPPPGTVIGRSREGRPLHAYRLGSGPKRVSVIAGCHADEPVGPTFATRLVAYLSACGGRDGWLRDATWWIVPNANPDGAARNDGWIRTLGPVADLDEYLRHVIREAPGEDVEFGFPRSVDDTDARPETRAIATWWREDESPFTLHASLHGMAFAGGPWFLIEPTWVDRSGPLRARCVEAVAALGYALHDVERRGEKGFVRIARGFCTRPSAAAMAAHFRGAGDADTARKFRPSSMDAVRAWGGDPLSLVSEMPLFTTPGVGETLGPPDPVLESWRNRIAEWRHRVASHDDACIKDEARAAGVAPMPILDQLRLIGEFLSAGLELAGVRTIT